MDEKELLAYMPHAKKCVADKFDAPAGVTCDSARAVVFTVSWTLPEPERLLHQRIPVWLCEDHDTFRRNGGQGMGPIVLRAGAEYLKRLKELDSPSRPVRRQKKEKDVDEGKG